MDVMGIISLEKYKDFDIVGKDDIIIKTYKGDNIDINIIELFPNGFLEDFKERLGNPLFLYVLEEKQYVFEFRDKVRLHLVNINSRYYFKEYVGK